MVVDWCCMCKRNGEIPDHLLLHCFSRVVEYGVFTIWGSLGYAAKCRGTFSKLVKQVQQTQI